LLVKSLLERLEMTFTHSLLAKRAVWYKRTGEHDGEEDALLAQLRLSLAVQPQLVVDNLISLCKSPSG
jgi:hypothetical protein